AARGVRVEPPACRAAGDQVGRPRVLPARGRAGLDRGAGQLRAAARRARVPPAARDDEDARVTAPPPGVPTPTPPGGRQRRRHPGAAPELPRRVRHHPGRRPSTHLEPGLQRAAAPTARPLALIPSLPPPGRPVTPRGRSVPRSLV